MDYLVFRLYAPMASWGDVAVGEMRGSRNEPSDSAVLGLLATALGIKRDDEAAQLSLRDGYSFAVAVLGEGRLLRDYHTVQVPGRSALRKRPHSTRRDELSVAKDDLNTILSTRDYRQDAIYLVTVQAGDRAPYPLATLMAAIQKPRYPLYFGRKACPPAAPLWPQIEAAGNVMEACGLYLQKLASTLTNVEKESSRRHHAQAGIEPDGQASRIESLHWGDGVAAGVASIFSVPRKDRSLSRQRWQFGDRVEHVWHRAEEN